MASGRLVVIGAHPDDCEIIAGGTAILYRRKGWDVTFITTTNGDAGHHAMSREALRHRRKKETEAVARLLGIRYLVMDNHDAELEPTLKVREELIRILRRLEPDVVITHPPVDYHPDHRYTSQVVGDTSFLLEVPLVCPDVPAMTKRTVYLYNWENSSPINSFILTVAIDEAWEDKIASMACHESQMFEWLPFIGKYLDQMPADPQERLRYLAGRWEGDNMDLADRFRDRLRELYGEDSGSRVRFAEAFYEAPFGRSLTKADYQVILPDSEPEI